MNASLDLHFANDTASNLAADLAEIVRVKFAVKDADALHDVYAAFQTALDASLRENDNWKETAERHARNEMFWRDLVMQTGRILGGRVYVQDDGGIVPEPLGLRVPEVAKELREAKDEECAWLRNLLQWCSMRLKHPAYKTQLDFDLSKGPRPLPRNEPRIVRSESQQTEA